MTAGGAHRVPADMFRFTTGDRAPLYSAILQAFGDANERLVTALGLDDVRERLRGVGWFDALTDDDLTQALKQLREWQLLDVIQNHAENYRTAQEYERRNLQYSLTRRGEAAFAGVQHALTVLASTGALQTAVLDAIADRLAELDRLLADTGSGDRRIFSTLQELEGLTRRAARQHQAVQRGAAAAAAHRRRRAVDVPRGQGRHRGLSPGVPHQPRPAVPRRRGGRRPDRGPRPGNAVAAGAARRRASPSGAPARPPSGSRAAAPLGGAACLVPAGRRFARQVEQLHHVARRAIVTLLQVLDRITESRRRSTGAVQDFRELARWFAAAPADDDLHRLWSTAFGLGPSRHAHLAHADPELTSATESWRDAPPVEVSALLRTSGRTERFTRTGRVRDVAELKAARAERARAERAELEAAWSLLRTRAPVRLSHFGALDHEVFERLMEVLGRALAARPDSTGVRRAVTGDGRVEVALRPPAARRAPAVLRTPRGTLTGPDFVIEVHTAGTITAGTVPAESALEEATG